jgi:hypothetical protein
LLFQSSIIGHTIHLSSRFLRFGAHGYFTPCIRHQWFGVALPHFMLIQISATLGEPSHTPSLTLSQR